MVGKITPGGKLTVAWQHSDIRWMSQTRWWVMQAQINGKWITWETYFKDQLSAEWPDNATAVAIRAAGLGWEVGEPGVVVK